MRITPAFEEWVRDGCPLMPNKYASLILFIVALVIGIVVGFTL